MSTEYPQHRLDRNKRNWERRRAVRHHLSSMDRNRDEFIRDERQGPAGAALTRGFYGALKVPVAAAAHLSRSVPPDRRPRVALRAQPPRRPQALARRRVGTIRGAPREHLQAPRGAPTPVFSQANPSGMLGRNPRRPARRPARRTPKHKASNPRRRRSAPVALGSRNSRSHFSFVSHGDDIIVSGADRLNPVEIDTTVYRVGDVNYSGAILAEYPIQPLLFGERLRRLANCFEKYSFSSVSITYEPAMSTASTGSILGFYDQDPTDNFDSGVLSLREAAAHPGASTTKVWEGRTWVMPKRSGGNYFVGSAGSTSADKRQQEQGTFRLLVDIPLDPSVIEDDKHYMLGSLFIKYQLRLSKPTIQPNFVGTSDLITWGPSPSSFVPTQEFVEQLRAMDVYPQYDLRSNAGSVFDVVAGAPATIAIPPGVWNVTFSMHYTPIFSPAAGFDVQFVGRHGPDETLSASVITDGDGAIFNTPGTPYHQYYRVFINAGSGVDRSLNVGCQVAVDAGTVLYLTPRIAATSGVTPPAITLIRARLTISAAWPTQDQQVEVSASSIADRLRALELRVSTDAGFSLVEPTTPTSEEKTERKSRAATPLSASAPRSSPRA